MSLFGAMFSGVTGLRAQSQSLSIISDNISNLNTVGYKATVNQFSTLVTNQVTTTAYSSGGVISHPKQLIDRQGLLESSESATDIAISGGGFFVVNTNSAGGTTGLNLFTRAGSFVTDLNGNLYNTGGYYLQGWPTDTTGAVVAGIDTSTTQDLQTVNVNVILGSADPTTNIAIGANLPAAAATGATENTNIVIYDSLGISHNLGLTWTKAGANQWDIGTSAPTGSTQITLNDSSGNPYAAAGRLDFSAQPADTDTIVIGGTTYEFDSGGGVGGGNTAVTIGASLAATVGSLVTAVGNARVTQGTGTDNDTIFIQQSAAGAALTVNAAGTSVVAQNTAFTVPALTAATPAVTFAGDGTPASFNVASADISWTTGAAATTGMTINLGTVGLGDGLTQFSDVFVTNFAQQNGVPFGNFSGVSIDNTGLVSALFDNGVVRSIYQLPIATFSNPNALGAHTGNAYQTTTSSGNPLINFPGIGPAGKINAGALEASTVDLAEEFTRMIVAQRAFSAASKVITTSDQMLDELTQIKR
ncbi:MAG TPA: flagellar hook-basal body complex protein [Rhodospirillales bacterium]|jgi:flagellar hook protein FlgE